jgi:peptide/nickel transport system permease protein
MIQTGATSIVTGQWWIPFFPGIAVFLTILTLNLIADALDVVLRRGSA